MVALAFEFLTLELATTARSVNGKSVLRENYNRSF